MSTDYTPNLCDRRVKQRAIRALGFALGVMSPDKPHQWSTRFIDQHMGQQQHPLSQWLRRQLLTVTDEHWSKDNRKCKQYVLNVAGAQQLKRLLGDTGAVPDSLPKKQPRIVDLNQDYITDDFIVRKAIEMEYGEQLRSGEFDYRESHNRLFNSLQNYKSVYRRPILAEYGYTWEYDIEACAPTIIEQLSRRYGNDLWMPHYQDYLDNKQQFRQQISQDFELDDKTTKILLNSLFCGAKIGLVSNYATTKLLHNDVSRIMLAKSHPLITGLRADIKTAWQYVTDSGAEFSRSTSAKGRLRPINSKQRWAVYFKYERYILNVVHHYLNTSDNRHLLEHDGWRCELQVDTDYLTQQIYQQTGFQIKLKEVNICGVK